MRETAAVPPIAWFSFVELFDGYYNPNDGQCILFAKA
jgi:hypothetical protein